MAEKHKDLYIYKVIEFDVWDLRWIYNQTSWNNGQPR